MKRIGLLSDTHGYIHPAIYNHFADCDEIWHCGDMGTIDIAIELGQFKPFKGVYGNIDGYDVRASYQQFNRFMCEEVDVLLTHIGGYPKHYEFAIKQIMQTNPPTLFACGHSHILKVMHDSTYNVMHMNPGAAGISGFHNVITFLKFEIDGKNIQHLSVIELPKEKFKI